MNKTYELQFEIETACLLNCIHCSSAGSRLLSKRQYSDEDMLRVLKLFQGKTRVVLTGGEPLLYCHIQELCEQISAQLPLSCIELYTTGNLANMRSIDEALAIRLKTSRVNTCCFSIYSNSAEIHDRWTQKAGSFRNTIESVTALKRAGISPKAHLVLTRWNVNDVNDLIHYCESIGMEEIRILKLAPAGNAQLNWDCISLPYVTQNAIIKQVASWRNESTIPITIAGYPKIMACRSFPDAKGCQAGVNLLYIDACGDIYPCACAKAKSETLRICNIVEINKLSDYLQKMADIEFFIDCLNSADYTQN